MINGKR